MSILTYILFVHVNVDNNIQEKRLQLSEEGNIWWETIESHICTFIWLTVLMHLLYVSSETRNCSTSNKNRLKKKWNSSLSNKYMEVENTAYWIIFHQTSQDL